MTFQFDLAPGAVWYAVHGFSAPVGKNSSDKRCMYHFTPNERIVIRSVVDDKLMISTEVRPTDFTSSKIWMDTTWVSEKWLKTHFYLSTNNNMRLYEFRRFGEPWSILGGRRILTDDDAFLEAMIAYRKREQAIEVVQHTRGGDRYYPLDPVRHMFALLQDAKVIDDNTIEVYNDVDNSYYANLNFDCLLDPWTGLIVVNNGGDKKICEDRGYRRTFTVLQPKQKQIFLVENEDDFFQAKLSLTKKYGPKFIHKDHKIAA